MGGAKGYMTAGSYPDDGLGEVFIKLGKQGSTLAGMMDSFSVAVSIALQHGVPLQTYVEKFTNLRFEPAGLTDDPDVRMSSSIMDYVFRRLALDHLSFEERSALGIYSAEERTRELETGSYLPAEDDSEDVEEELENLAQSAPSTPAQPEVVQPLTTGHATSQLPVVNVSGAATAKSAPTAVHSSAELFEAMQGRTADARCASPAARRCARPVPASSARAAAAPPAAADLSGSDQGRCRETSAPPLARSYPPARGCVRNS